MADALLIASLGGPDLWNKTQTAFMARSPRPYMKIVSAVLKADMTGMPTTIMLVCTVAVAFWHECNASHL